jgi:plastocyanin
MSKAIIAIIVAVVIGGGGYLVLHKNSNDSSKKSNASALSQASSSSGNSSQGTTNSSQPVVATITYSNNGFSPSTVTIKAGDTIAIKNTSSRDLQFDSDPHPSHTDDEELNVGIVSSGQTMTLKVGKTGSHGYHNHLNPSDTGTIVVQ